MRQAFESRGFGVNSTLWDFYSVGAGSTYLRTSPKVKCNAWQQWLVNEVPWSVYTNDVKQSFARFGDVAVITVSRSGGEYSDLHYNYTATNDYIGNNDAGKSENTSANGGYLGLTKEEKELSS